MENQLIIDLHMHSTVSDGTDAPEEILALARRLPIHVFALTDHDAVKGCQTIQSILREDDPLFIPGVEFSCRDDGGDYHILGYGYDTQDPGIHELVALAHRYRMQKVLARLESLKSEFGFSFLQKDVDSLLSMENPGKPHIGNLMVRYGYAETKDQAIREYINRLHVQSRYLGPEEAIRGILAAGGTPVLAHPFFGNGSQKVSHEEMQTRLIRLTGYGLKGVEAYYSGFTKQMRQDMSGFADQFDLYLTAGSDYHGKNKTVVPADTGLEPFSPLPDRLTRFLQAVC